MALVEYYTTTGTGHLTATGLTRLRWDKAAGARFSRLQVIKADIMLKREHILPIPGELGTFHVNRYVIV